MKWDTTLLDCINFSICGKEESHYDPNWQSYLIRLWGSRNIRIYYFSKLPLSLIKAIKGILMKDHILNEMSKLDYIGLSISHAQTSSGLLWRFSDHA